MLGGVGVGARDEHAPLRVLGAAGPDLLAGDDPVVAVADGAGLDRGQVRPGVGLGEPLAPDLLGGQDRVQITLALLLGPPRHDRRTGEQQPEHVRRQRRAGAAELLEEDRRLRQGRPAPAVLNRPVHGRPAVVGHPALEIDAPLVVRVLVADRLVVGLIGREPGPQLVAKRQLGRRERQIHQASSLSITVKRARWRCPGSSTRSPSPLLSASVAAVIGSKQMNSLARRRVHLRPVKALVERHRQPAAVRGGGEHGRIVEARQAVVPAAVGQHEAALRQRARARPVGIDRSSSSRRCVAPSSTCHVSRSPAGRPQVRVKPERHRDRLGTARHHRRRDRQRTVGDDRLELQLVLEREQLQQRRTVPAPGARGRGRSRAASATSQTRSPGSAPWIGSPPGSIG